MGKGVRRLAKAPKAALIDYELHENTPETGWNGLPVSYVVVEVYNYEQEVLLGGFDDKGSVRRVSLAWLDENTHTITEDCCEIVN